MRKVSLPNEFLAEADALLRQGQTVLIHIQGRSMRPFLKETGDCIELLPCPPTELVKGYCYFYSWEGNYMLHRYVGYCNGCYCFAGDGNQVRIEEVERTAITGLLHAVQHADGRIENCLSNRWRCYGLLWFQLRPLRRIVAGLHRQLTFVSLHRSETPTNEQRNKIGNESRNRKPSMNKLQEQFLELLRSGLWGTPARTKIFDAPTDWNALYRAALQQTVPGIVLDGLETLPRVQRPERNLYLQWCAQVLHLEEQNDMLDRRISELVTLFRTKGIEPVLMKGQGVARNYRVPAHRVCGDIDLYVGFEHFEKANRAIAPDVSQWHEIRYKHSGAVWRGAEIEIHQVMALLNAPGADSFLQREIRHWNGQPANRQLSIGNTDVRQMPLEFEVVYLLIHALGHFAHEGLGLRQVCDWTCLLARHAGQIDADEVNRLLLGTGLQRVAGAFGFLATEVLGLPPEALPFALTPDDHERGCYVLQHIWHMGNFGRYDPTRSKRPEGYWHGKWHTFMELTRRNLNHRRLAPAEAFWLPYSLIRQFAHAQLYHLRHRK